MNKDVTTYYIDDYYIQFRTDYVTYSIIIFSIIAICITLFVILFLLYESEPFDLYYF